MQRISDSCRTSRNVDKAQCRRKSDACIVSASLPSRPSHGHDHKSVQCDSRGMNDAFFIELSAWLTHAGLAGTPETEIVSVFCDRCVAAGIPLGRAHVAIDTLHPVHEGRLFRWGYSPDESLVHEYGRTSLEDLD